MKIFESLVFMALVYFDIFVNFGVAQFPGINFPKRPASKFARVGDPCLHHSGLLVKGRCRPLSRCGEIQRQLRNKRLSLFEVKCNPNKRDTLVCCKIKDTKDPLDIIAPKGSTEDCGRTWTDFGSIDLRTLYIGNITSKDYEEKGFAISIRNMSADHITEFDFSNGSYSGTWKWTPSLYTRYATVGSVNARKILTLYMALLGDERGWFCDGALINSQWVLTAAHCFQYKSPTIVRLGEYDHSDSSTSHSEVPLDFSISQKIIHPKYEPPSSYHDLALIKLNKKIPELRPDLGPICLPWGEEVEKDIIGEIVTLTGWGASFFLGPSTPILQEVNVTVFDPSICDKSYSTLHGYRSSFPKGITKQTSLCAGDENGGKDACQGDSGGPIVYLSKSNRFTLAGIVSTGNGCGLKEFPGIYVPMHNAEYLSWIKENAFKQ